MNKPRVAIAIATAGGRDFIFKTIKSVYEQNYENLVLNIVATEATIKELRTLIDEYFEKKKVTNFIPETQIGFSAAINQAFAYSKEAKYFGWINDDDFLAEGAVQRAIEALERSQKTAVFGRLIYLNKDGEKVGSNNFGRAGFVSSKYGPNLTPQPGSFFRVDAVGQSDLLEPSYKYAMDLDLWLRLAKQGDFIFLKEVQAFMLWHKDAITVKNRKKALTEAYEIRKTYSKNRIQILLVKIFWIPTKIIAYLSIKFI